MCSKTTVAPLDRIKILLQAHNKHYSNFGKLPCIFITNIIILLQDYYTLNITLTKCYPHF